MQTHNRRGKSIRILSDQGTSIIDVDHIDSADGRLRMKGRMIGEFPTTAYIGASDFYRILFSFSTLGFALLSPYHLLRRRHGSAAPSPAIAVLSVLVVSAAWLAIAFLLAMAILGVYTLFF